MRLRHLFLPLLVVLTLSSCEQMYTLFNGTGTLSMTLQDGMSRSLDPSISMSITKYIITGSGPRGTSFTSTVNSAQTVTQSEIAVGDWTVVANGYNASDVLVGTVTQSGSVTKNNTTNMTLRVAPLTGTGILNLTVTWPAEAALAAPEVTGVLTPDAGSSIPLTFSILGETATSSATVAAGYYTMVLTLRGSGIVKWTSAATTVRIAAPGVTTTVTFTLTMDDLAKGFFEDFNDGLAQGWVADSSSWSVADNTYKMQGNGTSVWRSSYYSTESFNGDFTYQASVNALSGTLGNSRGITFNVLDGAHPGINGYIFCVDNISPAAFWAGKYVAGTLYWSGWFSCTLITNNCVLKVTRAGSDMKFYIEGILVATWNDTSFTSGYAGVVAADYGQVDAADDVSWHSGTPAPSPSMSRATIPLIRPVAAGENPVRFVR